MLENLMIFFVSLTTLFTGVYKMVKIQFLGGCREVGRNAFLIESKKNLMLDYGFHL